MEYSQEQEEKIKQVIVKLSHNDPAMMNAPATRVLAINLLDSFGWDLVKTIESVGP